MAYSEKVLDHYEHPRNVGSMDKDAAEVGTGMVGAPACGDVMKLQIKVVVEHQCLSCHHVWRRDMQEATCPQCGGIKINAQAIIEDAKFKTFGCGSAIASSSLLTEWVKGKTLTKVFWKILKG